VRCLSTQARLLTPPQKPTYDSLQNLNEADYQEKVLKVVPKSSSTYRKPSSQRYGAKSTPTQPHFVGPQLSLRSTFEKPGSLNFKENVLGNSFRCYDGDYRSLQTKPADPPPTSESGDLGGMWIHTECVVDEQNLLCDGMTCSTFINQASESRSSCHNRWIERFPFRKTNSNIACQFSGWSSR